MPQAGCLGYSPLSELPALRPPRIASSLAPWSRATSTAEPGHCAVLLATLLRLDLRRGASRCRCPLPGRWRSDRQGLRRSARVGWMQREGSPLCPWRPAAESHRPKWTPRPSGGGRDRMCAVRGPRRCWDLGRWLGRRRGGQLDGGGGDGFPIGDPLPVSHGLTCLRHRSGPLPR